MSQPPADQYVRTLEATSTTERRMREQAERTVQGFARLLADVANLLAGKEIEAARVQDPAAPYCWSLERWEAFFNRHIFETRSGWGRASSGQASDPELLAELGRKDAEIGRQASEIQRLQKTVEAYRQQREDSDARSNGPIGREPSTDPGMQPASLVTSAGLPNAPATLSNSREIPTGQADLASYLQKWAAKPVPAEYTAKFQGVSNDRWTRQTMTLYLLAVQGICARPEIEQLLAAAGGVDRRTTAIRQAVDHLVQLGFASLHRLEMRQPLSTSLVALQLTVDGLALCRALGYEPIEQELQRYRRVFHLDNPSEPAVIERALCALAFTLQSRYRGYKALMAPPIVDDVQADVAIERGMERYLVFVGTDIENICARWQASRPQQAMPAICALDEPTCAHLAARCKSTGRSGAAADLSVLVRQRQPTAATPLWAQVW